MLVNRPRLFTRLSDFPVLIVVRGPRGAGKTSLLTTWASSSAPPGPVTSIASPDASTDRDAYWAAVTRRIDDVERADGSGAPVTVLLDDVDRLADAGTDGRILALLDRYPRLRVVVTTRSTAVFDDATPLDVDHVTVAPDELLFTADESRSALWTRGIELPRPLMDIVHATTGGYPPLVQSAAAVARPFGADHDGRESARRTLERAIDRYVGRTILDDPELAELRDFVLTIAAARTVTVPVAEVLAGPGAAEHVRTLETAGVLVRSPWPKDDEWAFPPPIRESLMRGVRLEAPAGPLRASGELASWLLDRGDVAAAIEHAVEAQDWDLTVEILESNWVGLVSRRFHLVRDALAALPADVAVDDVPIRAGRELFLRLGADATHFPDPPELDVDSVVSHDPQSATDTLAIGSVQSLILRVAGRFTQAAEMSIRLSALGDRLAAAPSPQVAAFLPLLRLQWGITHQVHGDVGRSSVEFRRAYAGNRPADTNFVARHAAGNLALNYALTGELGHAEAWLDKEHRHDDASTWSTPMARTGGLVASALVSIGRMELGDAEKTLTELGDLPDDDELWAFAVYAHCRLALVGGHPESGLDRLRRAIAVYERWHTPGSVAVPLLASVQADLHLALGHGNESWKTLEDTHCRDPWTTISRARLELASGRSTDALVDCTRPVVADCPFPRVRMESTLIQAAAQLDLGDESRARTTLRRAVAMFEQTGGVRPFAVLPAEWAARLSELDVDLPATWRSADPDPAVYPDRVQLVGLSERESAVLAALASTPSVAAIATQLFVSQNTVKTQLRSLYRKLDVHSRSDALHTAARLGLIDPSAST
ncbi:LuxR C-terminal-related transcriptional regulator [Prescottella sp. R16]|uniref:LuxR C-terminal-related transcriptional regulator n=1 Tax=Prescottella sp. R16 TaxID=3064529 RepID=UPI00272E288D|nr:LuxR C-terminal-related transcriptional regulator [Prescottella sp. R16]